MFLDKSIMIGVSAAIYLLYVLVVMMICVRCATTVSVVRAHKGDAINFLFNGLLLSGTFVYMMVALKIILP